MQAANLISQPKPQYPPLAKAARVQGTVKFQATIAKEGTIQNLQLFKRTSAPGSGGHGGSAAVEVQADILNGEPVEVITTIDVNFTLSQ